MGLMIDKPQQTVYNNRYIRYYHVYWKHRHVDLVPAYCPTQALAKTIKVYGGVFGQREKFHAHEA
jgi:hypothetical protein